MSLLRESWRRLGYALMAMAVAVAAVIVAPTPALADASDEPVVLTEDTHWFFGAARNPQPWPEPGNAPVEVPVTITEWRVPVHFGVEVRDNAAPNGYVLWQLFDEDGKQFFSSYLFPLNYYCADSIDIGVPRGTYVQKITPVGCEGTVCNLALEARTMRNGYNAPNPNSQTITVGATVESTLTGSYDGTDESPVSAERYYKDFKFTLDEPTNVEFSSQPIYGETRLSLMDAEGTVLTSATSPYDAEGGAFSAYDLDCGRLDTGEYYLRYEVTETPGSEPPALNREFSLSAKAGHEIYRLYNPSSGEHLYTASADERASLGANGWSDEGIAWYAPRTSDYPVYRLYNPNNGDHMYTTSKSEYDALGAMGWNKEDVAFYSAGDPAASGDDGVAVYRFFNPNTTGAGAHHFVRRDAAGQDEYAQLDASGWKYEGRGWTGMDW